MRHSGRPFTIVYSETFTTCLFCFTLACIDGSLALYSSSHLPDRSQFECASPTLNLQKHQVPCQKIFLRALFTVANHIYCNIVYGKTFPVNIMVSTVQSRVGIKIRKTVFLNHHFICLCRSDPHPFIIMGNGNLLPFTHLEYVALEHIGHVT